jgi:cobalt-zinc-cadmium efflux system protein
MLMHAAPTGIALTEIKSSLLSHPEVLRVEDLHVWSVSTTEVLLTAKLGCGELRWEEQAGLLQKIHEGLEHDFGIRHATLEMVPATEIRQACALDNKMSNIMT